MEMDSYALLAHRLFKLWEGEGVWVQDLSTTTFARSSTPEGRRRREIWWKYQNVLVDWQRISERDAVMKLPHFFEGSSFGSGITVGEPSRSCAHLHAMPCWPACCLEAWKILCCLASNPPFFLNRCLSFWVGVVVRLTHDDLSSRSSDSRACPARAHLNGNSPAMVRRGYA